MGGARPSFIYRLSIGLAHRALPFAARFDKKLARGLDARSGVTERLAAWARAHRDPNRPLLWVHASSVGEGLQAKPVLEAVRAEAPHWQLAYTFFSPSAERLARTLPVDVTDYLPLDRPADVRSVLDALQPAALVFSKLDVWPELTLAASRRGVKLGLISATVAILAGAGIYEARQASQLREQVQTLQQQQFGQIRQLQQERDGATNRLASLAEEITKIKSDSTELLKLRSEVGRQRKELNSDEMRIASGVMGNTQRLKHYFDQTPNAKTPELQFLIKEEWVTTAAGSLIKTYGVNTEKAYRHSASWLRGRADFIAGGMFRDALTKYKEINSGQFPADLNELKPYFERTKNRPDSDVAIENVDEIFQRWQIIPAAQVKSMIAGGDMVITQKAPVDDIFDDRVVIGNGVLQRSIAITLTR